MGNRSAEERGGVHLSLLKVERVKVEDVNIPSYSEVKRSTDKGVKLGELCKVWNY